jgi:fermentation-respiration switch protein FrsA (DUF1100 family)
VTAGREDGTAGGLGRLRTSRADREQVIDVLKAAFVQGRLAKDEFDARVGQVLASRTYAELIGQRPLLMIAGTRAVTSWMSIEAFQKATGPKELNWIDGASHVDLYDREQYVGPAVGKLARFLADNLGQAT